MPRKFDMSAEVSCAAGLAAAVEALRAGNLIAMPTETVYGLAADAANDAAVAAIYAAKGRPSFNPLIAHVASLAAAERIAEVNDAARRLAGAFWPGPLTMVLERKTEAPICARATAGLATIAVRVPAEPLAHELLERFDGAVVAPSANRSGHVSATTAGHVAADLGDAVAVILDDGPSAYGIESTIVDMTGTPTLLRAGAVPRGDIEATIGEPLAASANQAEVTAPGMLASHYAPAARLRLAVEKVRDGEALLAFGPDMPDDAEKARATINLSPSGDLREAASSLFDALRVLDGKAAAIAVMPIPEDGLGEAINDRLRRAAAPRDSD